MVGNSPDLKETRTLNRWKILLLVIIASVGLVAVATAHVVVFPKEVIVNGFEEFHVRVPSEREESTTKVRLEFPAGLSFARFKPKTGWNYEIEKDAAGNIAAVTWSGGQIGPQQYEVFDFTARAPKTPGALSFKAYQTYQSGTVVAWDGAVGTKTPASVVQVRDSASIGGAQGNVAVPSWPNIAALVTALVALGVALLRTRPIRA
jgi:uncharacterized protein YcnI